MSGHLWEVGDMAVCVNACACPVYGMTPIVLGATYRVVDVAVKKKLDGSYAVGLKIDRHNCVHPSTGAVGYHNHIRFRPVQAAGPAFTEQTRALKPLESA